MIVNLYLAMSPLVKGVLFELLYTLGVYLDFISKQLDLSVCPLLFCVVSNSSCLKIYLDGLSLDNYAFT